MLHTYVIVSEYDNQTKSLTIFNLFVFFLFCILVCWWSVQNMFPQPVRRTNKLWSKTYSYLTPTFFHFTPHFIIFSSEKYPMILKFQDKQRLTYPSLIVMDLISLLMMRTIILNWVYYPTTIQSWSLVLPSKWIEIFSGCMPK